MNKRRLKKRRITKGNFSLKQFSPSLHRSRVVRWSSFSSSSSLSLSPSHESLLFCRAATRHAVPRDLRARKLAEAKFRVSPPRFVPHQREISTPFAGGTKREIVEVKFTPSPFSLPSWYRFGEVPQAICPSTN